MSTELFLAVENNPQDVKTFEELVQNVISELDLETLNQIYENVPAWMPENAQNPMVRVLSKHARVIDEPMLASLLNYKNGMLLWRSYGEAQMAEMAFRKIEELPEEPNAVEELRAFYREFYVAQNNWRRLEQALASPAKGGYEDPIEAARVLGRWALEGDADNKAIGYWTQVHQADPDDVEAETALRQLYISVERWNALVDLLRAGLDRLPDDALEEKIAIHLEIIDIYKTRMNAATRVVAGWQAVLDLDPGNSQALEALTAEYTEMQRWPDLVKVLQQKVEFESDPEVLVSLHQEIATIMLERFSNAGEAIASYEAILEIQPDHAESIKVLKEIYDQRRDYDSYVALAQRELEFIDDEQERAEQLVALARLASERLRRPETPIALWEEVLTYGSFDAEALNELAGLFEREKSWDQLADVLERQVGLEEDVAAQVEILDKLGMVVSSRLEDEARAADVWREILARDKEHRKAQVELKKRYIDEGDWEGLEWFFRNYGDEREWVRTLEQQAKGVDAEEEKVALLHKAAMVWQEELGETRRAVKNLEEILEINPVHSGAAEQLIPIYQSLEAWKKLPTVYEIVLENTEDKDARRDILLARAEVYEARLRDPESAFFAYVQAVSEQPADTSLHEKLRELAEQSGNWESYVYVLQDGVDHIENDEAQISVLLDVGHAYRDQLQADEIALGFFNRVLALDPYHAGALRAAERAWEAMGAFDQLVLAYQKQLTSLVDSEERKEVYFKLVRVWRDEVGAADEAEAVLVEMLDEYPQDLRIHDGLIALYLASERFAELKEVLERKRDIFMTAEVGVGALADLESQLGMLSYGVDPSEDGVRAAVDHYEAALGHVPAHANSVEHLEGLISSEEERPRITRLLAEVYESIGSWDKLAQVLELQWAQAKDEDDQLGQIEKLERLSVLYRESLDAREYAWKTEGRLFELEPGKAEVRARFEALTEELGEWEALAGLYAAYADAPFDQDSRIAIKLEAARTWHHRLTDEVAGGAEARLGEARDFYLQVRDESPDNREAINALESIYAELGMGEALVEIYRAQIDLSDDVETKVNYLFQSSDLYRDVLEQPEEAIAPAEEALALVPGDARAVERLDGLLTMTERWDDLAVMLADTINNETDTARVITLKNRLAMVNEGPMEQPEAAIEIYADVLNADPDNSDAVEALARLFTDPDLAPAIAPTLQPYYERHDEWERLVELYAVREEASYDLDEKVDWRYRMAALYEEKGQSPIEAFEQFQEAALLAPGNATTLEHLLRLAAELEAYEELSVFLETVVEDIPDMDRRIATHRTIAELGLAQTANLERAETQLRAILEIAPTDMSATDTLIGVYRERGDSANLVDLLLRKADMDGVEAVIRDELYTEAGALAAESLDDAERAIEIFESLYQFDPETSLGLDELEVLYEQTGDWDNLVRIYRLRIDKAASFEEKKHYATLQGTIQAEQLESPEDAIVTWRQVLEWEAGDRDALVQLDGLYSQQGDYFNLKGVLETSQALDLEQDNLEGWVESQYRIAKLLEDPDQLGDLHAAVDAYGALLERQPGHDASIESLETILVSNQASEHVFKVLRPALEQAERFEALWAQYQILAEQSTDDPVRFVALGHEMGDLAELALDDPARSFDARSRGFLAAPRDEATDQELRRLAREQNYWEALVNLYAEAAEEADDDYLRRDLQMKSAAILMDEIGDAERSIGLYREVAAEHSDLVEAQDRLHKLYEAEGMWPELAETIRVQADARFEPTEKIPYLEKLAEISEAHLADAEQAYAAYQEILELDRHSEKGISELRRLFEAGVHPLDASERLEPIYREQSRYDELSTLLETKLGFIDDRDDQLQIMRELALVAATHRENAVDALSWYGRAFELDPEDEGLWTEVERLGNETQAFDHVAMHGLAAAEGCEDEERRVQIWLRTAHIVRDQLGDLEETEGILRRLISERPYHAQALRDLDQLLTQAERWADLEPILVAQADSDEIYDDERVQVLTRLAGLYRDQLQQNDAAVEAWRRVLDLQDMNEDALRALRVIYAEQEDYEALFEILQRLADFEREPELRARHLSDMGPIAELALLDMDKAVELWEEVLALEPDNGGALAEIQRLRLAQGESAESASDRQSAFGALVEAYERELRMEVQPEKARRVELFKQIGQIWQNELDDVFSAQSAWERARTEEPFDREVLDALREIHASEGNDSARSEILEAALLSEQYSADEERVLWRDLAVIRTDVFGDQPGAIQAWQAVLGQSPEGEPLYDDVEETMTGRAFNNLESLFESGAQWSELVGLYQQKLPYLGDDAERVETWLTMASLQADNLQDLAAAQQTYRDILASYPAERDASLRLDAIYEGQESWAELAELLLARDAHLSDEEDRLSNLLRLGKLYEDRLEDPSSAFEIYAIANEIRADEPLPLMELERLAGVTGQYEALSAIYERSEAALDGDAQVELLLKWGAVQRDQLGDPASSIARFEKVLSLDSENEAALRALVDLNQEGERWPELVDILSTLVEVTPNYDEKKDILQRIAVLQEEKLEDALAAVTAWELSLEFDERDQRALSELERLHIARHDWNALIDVYEKEAMAFPDKEVERRIQIAGIYEQYLHQVDQAVAGYEDVLGIDPGNESARDRLEMIYSDREDWDSLLSVYERAFDAASDEEARLEMAKRSAILYGEVRGDLDSAADAWNRVLHLKSDDADAFDSLESIYAQQGAFFELIRVREQRLPVVADADARADLLGSIAATYRDELGDVDSALGTYERLFEERPGDADALAAYDAILEDQGLFEQLHAHIERRLEHEQDPAARAELLMRQGIFGRDELYDYARAMASFERTLVEVPGHGGAVEALSSLYRNDARWDDLIRTLKHKLDHDESAYEKASSHVELAEIYREELGDAETALTHFEAAEQADPESQRALEVLADHYMRTEAYAKAMPRFEALINQLQNEDDRERLGQAHKNLGLCAAALYQEDQAIDELTRASSLMTPDRDILQTLGNLYYERSDFAQAQDHLQRLLDNHRAELSSDEQVVVLMRLGQSALKVQDIDRARFYLTQVVQEQPNNPQALRNIIEVLTEYEEWRECLKFQERLVELTDDAQERYDIYVAMGGIYEDELEDIAKANEAYRDALKLDVFPKGASLRLFEMHYRNKNYDEAIRNLQRLITLEEDGDQKAKYAYLAAVMLRDQLGEPVEAVKYLNFTLDHNLENLKAFRIIDEILTSEKDWKSLERNYRRMIERVLKASDTFEQRDALLFKLYEGLGEIYRSRLRDYGRAADAFQLARNMRPNDARIREILANLYESIEGGEDSLIKAAREHRWLIEQQANRYESYRKLVEIYKRAKRYDAAWCAAALLVALRQANEEEARFYKTYAAPTMAEPTRVVDANLWNSAIRSEREDVELGQILEIVYLGLGRSRVSRADRDYQLRRRSRLDLDEGLLLNNTIKRVLNIYGMAAPEIHRSEQATGIELLQTDPPKLRFGTDMLGGVNDKELAFHVARHLTYFRSEHLITILYPREALDSLYLGAASLVDPGYEIPTRSDVADETRDALMQAAGATRAVLDRQLTPEGRQQLTLLMRNLWARTPVPELGEWHRAVERTAIHAGIVACGDPALSLELLQRETSGMSRLTKQQKLHDHVLYVLGDQYQQLRRHLGIEIDFSELM